ncbi:beta-glucuronidase [Liquorilactobacillus satsumensis]|uniref:beta-glucuronidase n=1 Tax=Liquorilactobacillus satsumensis TaxID=259059 RepID=UPI0021C3F11C|nr:beta-glucuronidase [Liquorilactobacillus satsumensis]MCP9312470.1 beta-glucuronidase [Liquorilactobacillus satsumensis]MCP9359759.1 beta-glucuronidase [Liquorilactobacillus satsumensis]
MENSLLYPCNNRYRDSRLLDGLWQFQFDPTAKGKAQHWEKGLPQPLKVPVPGSFSELFTKEQQRDYVGDFWYETNFFVPRGWEQTTLWVRFGSLTQRATVYCNGVELTTHEGGFLPVIAALSSVIRLNQENKLVVQLNNELNETSLPCGTQKILPSGRKIAKPYFDFFNYAGIQRSVWLLSLPQVAIQDYSVTFQREEENALVNFDVQTTDSNSVQVRLLDAQGKLVAAAHGKQGTLRVPHAHWWQVRNAYLYQIVIQLKTETGEILDEYSDRIGIRTVEISGTKILLNGKPIYLKGFGKHEDFAILGKTFNWSVAKRDFELMKWSNANCFRTSHYPHAEEWYQFADEEGFLIIDEVPAVGMMRSTHNYVAAGSGKYTHFFETPTVPQLKANHLQQINEMIVRDKNHPSVIAWSLFNEPETTSAYAKEYFTEIFTKARQYDPQKRPLTGALEKNSQPDKCQCFPLLDFICLNRYYGWYISGGADIEEAEQLFQQEMEKWKALNLNVPIVFTEFGADTLPSEHKLPSSMWSQEYQCKYLKMNFHVFDNYDFVQGELVWCFADFQTAEAIMRVNGNRKGVFTRERQPKDAAFMLKQRWETK